MDAQLLLESYMTLGATGFCVVFLGYMLINLVKSQKAQDGELEAIRENISKMSEVMSNSQSIILKLVDKIQRINEQQNDERNRRHESIMQSHQSLLKEFDDVSDKVSYLSGRVNGSGRP
jgi:predicted RNase H-like nuclease (RuvC/YqgF family)